MPFKHDLTWMPHAKRWRKRYQGRTYYLKTKVNGRADRQGYVDALAEWERLKAHIDGLGPNPYTATGVLIPVGQLPDMSPESPAPVQPIGYGNPQLELPANDPTWILSRGIAAALHPDLAVKGETTNPYADERRVSALVTLYLNHRRQEAERGNLSLKQYDEDKRQVDAFRDFVNVNFPTLIYVDQISPAVLNLYRDKQTEISASNVTLKKRLQGVRKWLAWLIDRNILRELPKDMSNYAKVKLDKPRPEFFTIKQLQVIYGKGNPLLRACVLLGLNAGFTQRDCSTLTLDMIDWETGILARDRSKTGTDQRAKLWPETIAALKAVGHFDGKGPLLRNPQGKPLVSESVKENGKVAIKDTVTEMVRRLHATELNGKSFKHLRKTSANYIESWNPMLTGLFLAHAESGVKRHYVARHFEELYALTDKLRAELSTVWQITAKVA